jgi:YbbR domain-containing protein
MILSIFTNIFTNILITGCIIALFHVLWNYISSMTEKKEKDPFQPKIEKYKKMVEELNTPVIQSTDDDLSQDLENYINRFI